MTNRWETGNRERCSHYCTVSTRAINRLLCGAPLQYCRERHPVSSSDQTTLIVYPSDFPVKIMGRVGSLPGSPSNAATLEYRRQDFTQAVLMIVKRHAPDFDDTSLEVRISSKNNYLSLTCTVRATSREQLDALYQELCDHPAVVMVL